MSVATGARIIRGHVWAVELGLPSGAEKFHVIVSSNGRNASGYPWVHVVRLTAVRPKTHLPTIVSLPGDLPYSGWAMCDEVMPVRKHRLKRQVGVLARTTVAEIEDALRVVLAL